MALFYDPRDFEDQKRVESILAENKIKYELHIEPVTRQGPLQIFVADKDIPRASELIMHHGHH